jgi:PHD/YefM family antitoxin component YafN of YafNO toxin-antitoxin module
MRQVSISEFKAKCHALLERVCSTGKPITVTRFVSPANDEDEWGVLRD